MNTVESPDNKVEMNDVQKLLNQEASHPEYPPPYEDHLSKASASSGADIGITGRSAPYTGKDGPSVPVGPSMIIHQFSQNSQPLTVQPQAQMMGHYNVGRKRMTVFCQNCQSGIKTETKTTHKCCTHCCCLLLMFTAVLGPCCCLPYCFFSPDRVEHTCPNCKGHIGTYYG